MSLRLLPGAVLFVFAVPTLRAADPPPPFDPRGLSGPLVLTSGTALTRDARDTFFALAGKDRAKIVVVPTALASGDDPKTTDPLVGQWEKLKPASVVLLHTRDRKRADDPAFVKPLSEATGVWFTHGHTDRVLEAYRGTLVEKELRKLHARGGVIGCATSGSALVGTMARAGAEQKWVEAFGLLPGFLLDRKDHLSDTIASHPAHVGLVIPDGAGLVVSGRVARVIGDVPVTVHVGKGAGKPAANEDYETGALLDLVQLQRAARNRAAKDPFPPAKPAEPVVGKGALVIVGGGQVAESIWKRFIALAGGPEATIVFVPTALDKPLVVESAEEKDLKRYAAKHVVLLHTRDRKEANDPKFSEVLTKATGVWFSGGRQWRFADSYEGTLTEKRFRAVLERGGVIGGSSAGASIQSEYMPRGHPLSNTVMAAEGYERGFGFLPGCAIDQHFFAHKRTADMTGLMKQYPQYLGIGIDEGTALVVTGSTAEVIGKSTVAFYDTRKKPTGTEDYEEVFPNEKYDLKARKKVK
jgi:cyanophycinase